MAGVESWQLKDWLEVFGLTLACGVLCFSSPISAGPSASPQSLAAQLSYSARWQDVIDHGDLSTLMQTYALVTEMYRARWSVTGDDCRQKATRLDDAVRVNPMSFAVRSLEVDCAKATGAASVAAEQEKLLRSLMQQAIDELPPDNVAFERYAIPVLSEIDAYAFVRESGEHVLSAHYDLGPSFQYAPLGMDLWSPSSLHERTLWFDWFNGVLGAAHDPDTRFPDYRSNAAKQLLKKLATPGSSAQAASESLVAVDLGGDAGLARAESLAAQGNYPAMVHAVITCLTVKEFGCAPAGTKMLQPWLQGENSWARLEMAFAYAGGIGVEKNPAAALELIQIVDKRRGDRSGSLEFAARRFPANENKIDPLVRTDVLALANNGSPVAELLVADEARSSPDGIHLEGRVLEGLKHAAAAGLPTAEDLLGQYLLGAGDDAAGVGWLEKAALSGNSDAQSTLGNIYRDATNGQARDSRRGIHWSELAEQVGPDPLAMALIGSDYLDLTPQDASNRHLAERWLQNAAAGGDRYGSIWLARLYESGAPGVTGGHNDAVALYQSLVSASATDAASRWYLARLLGMQSDAVAHEKEIRQLQKEAADYGDGSSQSDLALDLVSGRYGPADPVEAAKWFRLASRNGDIDSIRYLASMLVDGVWVPFDKEAALALWRRGIAMGDEKSKNNMAWALCTNPNLVGSGAKEGLRLAQTLDNPQQSAQQADTLAGCYGAVGDFKRATETEQKAVTMQSTQRPEETALLDEFKNRLDRYKRGLPYIGPALKIQAGVVLGSDDANKSGKK